jgi:hypothetical protein
MLLLSHKCRTNVALSQHSRSINFGARLVWAQPLLQVWRALPAGTDPDRLRKVWQKVSQLIATRHARQAVERRVTHRMTRGTSHDA